MNNDFGGGYPGMTFEFEINEDDLKEIARAFHYQKVSFISGWVGCLTVCVWFCVIGFLFSLSFFPQGGENVLIFIAFLGIFLFFVGLVSGVHSDFTPPPETLEKVKKHSRMALGTQSIVWTDEEFCVQSQSSKARRIRWKSLCEVIETNTHLALLVARRLVCIFPFKTFQTGEPRHPFHEAIIGKTPKGAFRKISFRVPVEPLKLLPVILGILALLILYHFSISAFFRFFLASLGAIIGKKILEAFFFSKTSVRSFVIAQEKAQKAFHEGKYEEAFEQIEIFRESEFCEEKILVGQFYQAGIGIRADPFEALRFYSEASKMEACSERANYLIGCLFNEGNGVVQDLDLALEFFKLSDEKDFAPAQYKLGLAFENGRGVNADFPAALAYYEKAAAKDFFDAAKRLAALFFEGTQVPRDNQKAFDFNLICAHQGDVESMLKVADYFSRGLVPRNAEPGIEDEVEYFDSKEAFFYSLFAMGLAPEGALRERAKTLKSEFQGRLPYYLVEQQTELVKDSAVYHPVWTPIDWILLPPNPIHPNIV